MAKFEPPEGQKYAVCAFITAHPDNLERAEAELFSKFIKEQLPQFTNGEGFSTLIKKEQYKEPPRMKVYDSTPTPPQDTPQDTLEGTNIEELGKTPDPTPESTPESTPEPETPTKPERTVFDFKPEDIVQEYYIWKSVNKITLHKYLEENLGHIPHRRVMKIFGTYKNAKKADKAAKKLQQVDANLNYYVCPMQVFIPTDPISIQCKENHNANKELTEIMEDYEENQQESKDLMMRAKNENLHNLVLNNDKYIKQISNRGIPDVSKMVKL